MLVCSSIDNINGTPKDILTECTYNSKAFYHNNADAVKHTDWLSEPDQFSFPVCMLPCTTDEILSFYNYTIDSLFPQDKPTFNSTITALQMFNKCLTDP